MINILFYSVPVITNNIIISVITIIFFILFTLGSVLE